MSNLPNPPPSEQSSESGSLRPRPYAVLLKIGAGAGVMAIAGGIAAVIWGDHLIETQVLPRVETEIANTIGRPIDLGEVEGFSVWGIRLGPTAIPATATDETAITAAQVGINIDLRSLIFQRVIKPHVVIVRPEVDLVQGQDGQWLEFNLPEPRASEPPFKVEIQSIEVQAAQLTASTLKQDSAAVGARDPVQVSGVDVSANFRGEDSQQVAFELAGQVGNTTGSEAAGRFDIQGEGHLVERTVQANMRAQDLPTIGINLLLPALVGLEAGTISGNLTAAAALTDDNQLDLEAVDLQGTARLQDGEVLIRDLPQPVRNIRSQLRFQGQRVTLEDTGLQIGDITLLADGDVDLQTGYDLTAQMPAIALADVKTLAEIDLPVVAAGDFQLVAQVTGELLDPQLQGRLTNLRPAQIDQVVLTAIAADFAANQTQFDLTALRIVPAAGGLIIAEGQADLTDLTAPRFQLAAQVDLPVDLFTQLYGVTLPAETIIGTLTADVTAEGTWQQPTALAQWQLSDSTFPGRGRVTLADNQIRLDDTRLQVADGTVTAAAIAELEGGDWQATAATDQVPVEQFTRQAQGLLSANLAAAGNLYDLDWATIRADGDATIAAAQVQLTPTSEPLLAPGDWTTAFRWQGDRIAVDQFMAPGVQADGTIGVDWTKTIPLGAIALNVALRDVDLRPLNSLAPATVRDYVQLNGLTSFDGQITGTLDTLALAGTARLANLAVNELAFETLRGSVALSLNEGGSLDLRGAQDRLQLTVSDRPWPVAFTVRNQDFVATGYGEGNRLYADITQFPLAQLKVRPAAEYGFGPVTGLVDASLEADLTDFTNPIASGTLTVSQPSLNPIEAEQITAAFRYADNIATLEQGELLLDNSRFLLTGQAALQPEVQYQGDLTIAEGQVADLVTVLQAIDLSAFGIGPALPPLGTAADVDTQPVGLPNASFLTQLESFVAFVETLPAATGHESTVALPPLEDLSGEFMGTIAVAGRSLAFADLTADIDLRGNGWQWGPYAPTNQFAVTGAVQQATVTLDPVVINAGETVINLAGSGNLERLRGELLVDDLPIALVSTVYPLPVSLEGDVDIVTNFDGSLANPLVTGEALIVGTKVDEQPIHRVGAEFRYHNALLEVDGEAAIDPTDEPMTVVGTIPYALPFMTAQPPTNQIAVTAIAPSDSFDLVNELTADQVRWEAGTGEVVVQVGGTLAQPAIAGTASFQDGVVSSQQLGESLTNLNGDVQFNLERVGIQQLQANLGTGQIEVKGQLPILLSGQSILASASTQQQPPVDSGLRVSLQALPIDYSGILQAVFDGEIAITGALLEPTINGQVAIGNGQVRANELLSQAGALNLPTQNELAEINPYRAQYLGIDPLAPRPSEIPPSFLDQITLQNFVVALSDRLVVAGQPFYNIAAEGGITLNGSLADLQPAGTIALKSGWINLLSTQFRLDANAPNTATFTPEDGLNPYVDVVLTARVRETDITPVPPSNGGFAGSEINDNTEIPTVGDVNYINVRAVAMGRASELNDSIALESNPPRSQADLVALLGSSLAGGLSTASFTQVAEFLGAGSLAGFGNSLADTLGLQSFSVFPTTDTAPDSTASIGLGVEASFAIGDSIGINVLEILNSGNPPQIGVQYRLTEKLQLRGLSNLDDTEVRLEYSTDF